MSDEVKLQQKIESARRLLKAARRLVVEITAFVGTCAALVSLVAYHWSW